MRAEQIEKRIRRRARGVGLGANHVRQPFEPARVERDVARGPGIGVDRHERVAREAVVDGVRRIGGCEDTRQPGELRVGHRQRLERSLSQGAVGHRGATAHDGDRADALVRFAHRLVRRPDELRIGRARQRGRPGPPQPRDLGLGNAVVEAAGLRIRIHAAEGGADRLDGIAVGVRLAARVIGRHRGRDVVEPLDQAYGVLADEIRGNRGIARTDLNCAGVEQRGENNNPDRDQTER